MATKKKTRASESKVKKRKKKVRLFWLFLMGAIGLASFLFLFSTISDFLNSPGPDREGHLGKIQSHQVTLFFSDTNERFLMPEKRLIPKPAGIKLQAAEIVKALIDGPQSELIRTLPENARLLNVQVDHGTAFVDFNADLISRHPGGSASEIATIYSLTNSLTTNLPAIQRVKILVQGKDRETLKGHMDLTKAFTFNKEIVRKPSGQ